MRVSKKILSILLTLVLMAGIFGSSAGTAFASADPPAITITTTTLPEVIQGNAYNQTLSAANQGVGSGMGSITWTISGGSLPPGLALSPGGVISGTPAVPGTYPFTVKAAVAIFPGFPATNGTKALSIVVWGPPVITTTSLPVGIAETYYSQTLAATGYGTITWSTPGGLPPGLTLSPNGAISGTPEEPGTFSFTVQAANGSASIQTKEISAEIWGIITTSLPTARTGTAYRQTLTAGGTPVWSIDSGNLPPGLTLNTGTGEISGSPKDTGTFRFRIKAAYNASMAQTREFSLVVEGGISDSLLAITTASLPNATLGTSYHQTLTASGSVPRSWGMESGILPPGMTLNTSTGVISGTPTASGTFRFSVKAYYDALHSQAKELSVVVGAGSSAAQFSITTASLPNAAAGTNYSQTLAANTSVSPKPAITWSRIDGNLPPGLALNTNTGVISGTPQTAGTFTFTITASYASQATAKELSVTVTGATPSAPAADPNAALTTLTKIAGQAVTTYGTGESSASPETVSIHVANGVANVALAGIVTADERAVKILYPDAWFATKPGAPISLTAGGATHVYVKVTMNATTRYYDVTVNRAAVSAGKRPAATTGSSGSPGSTGGTNTTGKTGGSGSSGNASTDNTENTGFAGDTEGTANIGIGGTGSGSIVGSDNTVIAPDHIFSPEEMMSGTTAIPADAPFLIAALPGSIAWDDTKFSGHFDESLGGFVFTPIDASGGQTKSGLFGRISSLQGKSDAVTQIIYTDENGNHISLPVTITEPLAPASDADGDGTQTRGMTPGKIIGSAAAIAVVILILAAILSRRKGDSVSYDK